MLGDKLFSFLYCSDPSWLPSYVLFTAAVLFVCAMPSTTTTEKPRRSETTGIILYGSHRTMHWKKLQYGVMTEIWHHQLPIFILRKSMGWNHQSIRLKPYVLVPYRYSPSTAKVGWEGICAQWSIYQVWRQDNMKDTAHHSYIFVHSLSHSFLCNEKIQVTLGMSLRSVVSRKSSYREERSEDGGNSVERDDQEKTIPFLR